ncbi:MAG: AmmeMemoRadiSam system radical SAM enzyme [Deltaproteobacteria bacterium]|nr:AmmeMemoRadiSam system radical SAM enzyme [Candidatus Zymogenaceae bacterium]
MKEALFYETLPDGRVACHLCPHECLIAGGKRGICGVRENRNGTLIALTYQHPASMQMDPIEKKPLYHVFPGSRILSLGSVGCNLSCGFCQNWSLVESAVPQSVLAPGEIPDIAKKHGSIGVAWTYNEPFIWYEYIMDAGRHVKDAGLVNVLITNGYVNPEPLRQVSGLIDAMNIDLKAIDDSFYRRNCKGRIDPVRETIRIADESCLVEVTNLLIPGQNDSADAIGRLVDFIASVNKDIPLHFSRYFPHRSFSAPPTPERTLTMAFEIARERLSYVYLGNITLETGNDTHCPQCGGLLVSRSGYHTQVVGLTGNTCADCNSTLNFINSERP